MTSTRYTFETESCSRCGGTGHMPFTVYGGKCFRCSGKGSTLSRRGLAARRGYLAVVEEHSASIAPEDVIAGDVVRYAANATTYTVTGDGATFTERTGAVIDGVCEGSWTIQTKRSTLHVSPRDLLVVVTPEARAAGMAWLTRGGKGRAGVIATES